MIQQELGPIVNRGHPFESQTFNLQYENGKETLSCYVPERALWWVEYYLRHHPENPNLLKQWAVCILFDRGFDLDRCCGFSMRITPENKVEIRLQFDRPWYEKPECVTGADQPTPSGESASSSVESATVSS